MIGIIDLCFTFFLCKSGEILTRASDKFNFVKKQIKYYVTLCSRFSLYNNHTLLLIYKKLNGQFKIHNIVISNTTVN